MILKVFTVFDSKIGAYMQPFFLHSRGQAIREFGDTAQDTKSPFFKHPEDFTLFELGEYDDQSACFDMYPTPVSIGLASELLSR